MRLFVPGWAGISATKWLVSLTAIDYSWDGFYNVQNYVLFDEAGNPIRPVRTMPVKSTIATPVEGAVLPPGPAAVTGFAWSGDAAIDRVEVSVDGGETYADVADYWRDGSACLGQVPDALGGNSWNVSSSLPRP